MRKSILGAVLLAILAGMALAACGDDDDDDGATAFRAANDAGDADVPASGEASSGGDGVAPGYQSSLLDRKIIFTADMRLEATDVRGAYERAALIARQSGGFVERSSLSTRDDDDGQPREYATVTIRIPVAHYDDVLNDLRAMNGVEVLSEESSSTEVTEEYTDLQSRIRNLERTEAQYLTLLDRADTIDDILTVNDRLDGVRSQIEQIQGRLNLLDDLTDLATVSMSISPLAPAATSEVSSGKPSFVDNFSEAIGWSGDALARLLAGSAYIIVAAMWLIVPGMLAVVGVWFSRRKETPAVQPPA
ncbi:MAG: DUF4349 domain-containing protein [Dehalococcoidia bacterium]